MPLITFRNADGTDQRVDAKSGASLMQAARSADISGILAECGGEMVCATCHVYVVSTPDIGLFTPASAIEADMLDFTSAPRRETSRLSCQLIVSDDLDGLVVEIPGSQV